MLRSLLTRATTVGPLLGDFVYLVVIDLWRIPVVVFSIGAFFALTSVMLFAGQFPDRPMAYWFQADGLGDIVKFIADRPFSIATLIFGVYVGAQVLTRFRSEHDEVRKKLGLVPLHELTEAEKDGIVVTASKLRANIQEQSNWIEDRFVTRADYEKTTREVDLKLEKILKRGEQIRKDDPPLRRIRAEDESEGR